MWSPVSLASFESHDVQAPGAPTFANIVQLNNTIIQVDVVLPSVDADGTALSGLKQLVVVSAPQTIAGVNAFDGVQGADLAKVEGAQVQTMSIDESAAGTTLQLVFKVVSPGAWQSFAAACNDEPAAV